MFRNFWLFIGSIFIFLSRAFSQDYGAVGVGVAYFWLAAIVGGSLIISLAFVFISLWFYAREKLSLKKRILIAILVGLGGPLLILGGVFGIERLRESDRLKHFDEFGEIQLADAAGAEIANAKVRLRDHRVHDFPPEIKAKLSEARSISFVEGFSSFEPDLFKLPNKIVHLYLTSALLKGPPTEMLKNFSGLELLSIEGRMPQIPSGAFAGLSNLTVLILNSSKISQINENAFVDLAKIETISLFNNELTYFPRPAFSKLAKLRILSLDKNQLRSIPSGAFEGLKNLEYLSLNQMPQLENLEPGAFRGLSKIKKIDLSYTGIKSFSKSKMGVPSSFQLSGWTWLINWI